MIRAIIFDCFGVLYADSGLIFYEKNVPHYTELHDALMDIDKQYDYGLISFQQKCTAVAELTNLDQSMIAAEILKPQTRNNQLVAYSQQLRQNYKIGMLSNIGRGGMNGFFSVEEREKLFDAVVLSSDVGVTKPDREIFNIMAERLGFKPQECLLIDDRQDNCDGAVAAGMKAVLFQNTKQTIHEVEMQLEPGNA